MNINSFSNYVFFPFKERILPALTTLQKRTLLIASLALGCLAIAYAIRHFFFKPQLNRLNGTEKGILPNKEGEKSDDNKLNINFSNERKNEKQEPTLIIPQTEEKLKVVLQDQPTEIPTMREKEVESVPLDSSLVSQPEIDSFEGQLSIFCDLSYKKEAAEKRKACLKNLLNHLNVREHLKIEKNRDAFFDNLSRKDYRRLSQDEFKVLQDLYFTYASDIQLETFIDCLSEPYKGNYSLAFNLINSFETQQVKRLVNLPLVFLSLDEFLGVFTIAIDKREKLPSTELLFEIIFGFYQAQPHLPTWDRIIENQGTANWLNLRALIIGAQTFRKFDTFNSPQLNQEILETLRQIPAQDIESSWQRFFPGVLTRLALIEENKQQAFIQAVFNYSQEICYECIMHILKTNNQTLITACLKEFLTLNHAAEKPEKGLSCIIEFTTTKEQALALIQTIQSFPQNLQDLHLCELHNRILLMQKPSLKKNADYFFGRISRKKRYQEQDWKIAFQECGLELEDYARLEDNGFKNGCHDYHSCPH